MIAKGTGIARVIYDPERETVYAVRPSEQMLFDVSQGCLEDQLSRAVELMRRRT